MAAAANTTVQAAIDPVSALLTNFQGGRGKAAIIPIDHQPSYAFLRVSEYDGGLTRCKAWRLSQ